MTEFRRRKVARHKGGNSRNGITKGVGGMQSGKDGIVILGMSLQQLIVNGFGILTCLYMGYKHAWFMSLINENHMWFSNIKVRIVI